MTTKTLLVIGRDFHPDGKETASLIADAMKPFALEAGYDVRFLPFKEIIFDISNDGVSVTDAAGIELCDYAAVLMTNWFSHASIRKDIGFCLGLYFTHNDVPFFNEEASKSRSTSKLSQLLIASYENVPIARTIFCLTLDHARAKAEHVLTVPFIMKDAQASRGKGNYLMQSFDEVGQHATEHTEKNPFVFQSFIRSDGSDYRFFVADDERVVIKRTGSMDSHLNNTSAGGSAELVNFDEFGDEVRTTVSSMRKRLGRQVTGIDIMFESATGKHYFLEANPIPQIATGSFTDQKLAALTRALVKKAEESRS